MSKPLTRSFLHSCFLALALVSVNLLCSEPAVASDEASTVLAQIGERTITKQQFEEELARRSNGLPGAFAQEADRRAVLDELIERDLLVEAAFAAGYDQDEEVQRSFEDLVVQKYRQENVDTAVAGIEISSEEVETFYTEHKDLYELPPRRRAAVLKMSAGGSDGRGEVDQARKVALELPESPAHFGAMAAELSHDRATRYRGGDMGYLDPEVRYRWPGAVVFAAFALEKVGNVSEVIEEGGFYWLVRLVESEERSYRSLAEMQSTIRHELHRLKTQMIRANLMIGLRSSIQIDVSESVFGEIELPPEQTPPSLPKDSSSESVVQSTPEKLGPALEP